MPRRNLYVSLPGSPAIILSTFLRSRRAESSVIYIPSVAPLFAHFSQHRPGEILPRGGGGGVEGEFKSWDEARREHVLLLSPVIGCPMATRALLARYSVTPNSKHRHLCSVALPFSSSCRTLARYFHRSFGSSAASNFASSAIHQPRLERELLHHRVSTNGRHRRQRCSLDTSDRRHTSVGTNRSPCVPRGEEDTREEKKKKRKKKDEIATVATSFGYSLPGPLGSRRRGRLR